MEVFYYKDPDGNFGDDLNQVLWPHILSKDMFAIPDVVVVGIGSILNEHWLGAFAGSNKRILVLGAGTSYGHPPAAIGAWSVLAVRGPLTADLIGLPEKAATDGAVLLAAAPKLLPPAATKTDVLFMPHHRSLRRSRWREIAARAGIKFVSPREPVDAILTAFSSAKLVLAEAMHGAIVADTLRIPWIPLTIAPTVDEFKWRDWTQSVNLPFEPSNIAAGHPADHARNERMAKVLVGAGVSGHENLAGSPSREQARRYFDRRFSAETQQALLRTGPGRIRSAVERLRPSDAKFEDMAVRTLRAAAARAPYLSSDAIFGSRLNQMLDAVAEAERIARSQL
ncbi:MAG TPA: polysaccharide pyruvyl transferase family protein [Caulobacterales bacterium]|nr:polysaccharide pyruvyl transferase family protein [Caulobacterales bacterium]